MICKMHVDGYILLMCIFLVLRKKVGLLADETVRNIFLEYYSCSDSL